MRSALLATSITDFSLWSSLVTWYREFSAAERELSSVTEKTTTNPTGWYFETSLSS